MSLSLFEKNIRDISDWDITHGKYRLLECQWDINNPKRCTNPVIPTKSYCDEHFYKIYKKISDEEAEREIEKLTDTLIKDEDILLPIIEEEPDA